MSFPGLPLNAAAFLATDLITIVPKRRIATFVAQVTLEEEGVDELTITQHPVQQGAPVSDHAYKNPSRLTVRIGYSNSSIEAFGDANYVSEKYEQFLELQNSRVPFDVVTGKRTYQNMLIAAIAQTTDAETETSLILRISFQQVIIVQTQATAVPANDVQKDPQKTGSIQNSGTKQLASAPNFVGPPA